MKNIKILVVGINYFPEITSTGLYTTEMCEWLRQNGHEVTMVTAFPYYPEWKIYPEYKNKTLQKEEINGVKVLRSYVYVPKIVTTKSRIIHELSFGISSLVNIIKQFVSKPDIVVSICPPFQLGMHGYLLSKILGIPFVYHIQDLQLDAAVDMNMIKNKRLIDILQKTEHFLFSHANLVTTISLGMREKILQKGIREDKVVLFPNWSDINTIRPMEKANIFRKKNGIKENEFVVLYAGNMGEKQALDSVIESANILKINKDIKFIFVGSGAKKKELQSMVFNYELKNVMFLDVQPKDELVYMLNSADVSLVTQQKAVTDIVMPSKLTNILASGTASIICASTNCEAAKIVSKFNCGVVLEPENPQILANSILSLSKQKEKLDIMGDNARKYAETYLDSEKVLADFECNLLKLVGP